jgi:hypothetical protein
MHARHQKKIMCQIIPQKKIFNFCLCYQHSYVRLRSYVNNTEEKNATFDQIISKKSIFHYVTLINVQNNLHHSVCTILCASEENSLVC